MKKFVIIAILAICAMSVFSQEQPDTSKMKSYTVEYTETSDTLNTMAMVFENDYMKRTNVVVIIKSTHPVKLYEEKFFYTVVGTPIKKENVFMFLVPQGNGKYGWITP